MQSESCPSEVINAGRCNMPGEQQVESSWANRCDSWDSLTERQWVKVQDYISKFKPKARRNRNSAEQKQCKKRQIQRKSVILCNNLKHLRQLCFISCLMILACLYDRDLFLWTEIAQKTTFNCVQVNTMQWGQHTCNELWWFRLSDRVYISFIEMIGKKIFIKVLWLILIHIIYNF